MKLVKQVSLYYREGRSDKVYEVDLCEVTAPGQPEPQYVVNFRYGRRGTTLRDGTKTVAPVSHERALAIFERLVDSKVSKGYQYAAGSDTVEGAQPPPEAPPEPLAEFLEAEGLDPRRQAVLQRLAEGRQSSSKWKLSRAVWRAGELQLKEAEPLLLQLIEQRPSFGRRTAEPMLDYCIAAALSRCGSAASLDLLERWMSGQNVPAMVRRMAADAYRGLLDEPARADLVRRTIDALPEPLRESARGGPPEVFQERLAELLADGGDPEVLDTLYRIDNEHVRPGLLDALRTAPLQPSYFQWIRHIFKMAEMRRDAEVFGLIAYRFETTRSTFRNKPSGYYWSAPPKKKTIGPNAERAFAHETRYYFRRRIWRTLQRLGNLDDSDYVKMAVGVLLPFTDDDAQPVREETRYDWSQYSRSGGYATTTTYWDRYAPYWAFCQILYGTSPRYAPDGGKRYFMCVPPYQPGGEAPAVREESFAKLWEATPQGLLHLLDQSRCEVVHEFAARTLRACKEFCDQLDLDTVLMLIRAPYAVTVDLGFDLAVSRYDPAAPNRELVLALATCDLERGRRRAFDWIQVHQATFLHDSDFVVALVTCRHGDTRQFALESLQTTVLDEATARVTLGRLIAALQAMGKGDETVAADAGEIILRAFGRQLRNIGEDVIRDLLAHPLAEVQRLAGEMVLGHGKFASAPPEDILRGLLRSEFAPVRAVGVKIVGQLPDYLLKQSIELLFTLSRSEHPEVRETIRPAVARLIAADRTFARRMAEMLIESLLVPGAPEGVPSHTAKLLLEDFREQLSFVSAETVYKLLRSRSMPAKDVGAALLSTNVRSSELGVEEIVRLADNDRLAVREASWEMCRENIARLRRAMAATIRLLDTRWDDSREFGFKFIRENFTQDELTPSILVAICDSVRPEVQQFGRELITAYFDEGAGPEYLLKLSEHPTAALQMFATNYLDRYASGSPERLRQLRPYFLSVLSRVNKARVAKDRVLAFLEKEALLSETAAGIVAEILARQSATCAIGDRAKMIEAMVRIQAAWPEVPLPIEARPVEVRDGV